MSDQQTVSPARADRIWSAHAQGDSILAYLASVWAFRNLFIFFANKSLFQIFRRTVLGIGWMVIHPLALAIPATFVVQDMLGISSVNLPMPLFILLGLSLWIHVRRGLQWMTKSALLNRSVLSRAYVPLLLLMLATLAPALFEFVVALLLALVVAAYYALADGILPFVPGWHNLWVIAAFMLATLLAVSISCFTSILNVLARDTWLTMRYVLSIWMLASAIFYPVEAIPVSVRALALLNPLMPVVELFRAGFTGQLAIEPVYLGLAILEIMVLLYLGLRFFISRQHVIFDRI